MKDCITYKDATICELLDEHQMPTGEFCIIINGDVVECGLASVKAAKDGVTRLRAKSAKPKPPMLAV